MGVIDITASDVPENVLLAHALANVAEEDKSSGWAVKRSGDFVNEYARKSLDGSLSDGTSENPNHLLGSFPCLFPYGQGGYEVDRPSHVSYAAHAKWSLRYDDKRFRKDHHFMFQTFGVLQKRELCSAACLQLSKQTFARHERAIKAFTPADFQLAANEEKAHKQFSNPDMRALRQTLSSVRAKVMGTDESRRKLRAFVWGMCVKKNPPSVWLTINPSDTQDPIAQVLCGEDIDLDHFCSLDHRPSAALIASDPYAAATFFRLIINAVLHCLLGINAPSSGHPIERHTGILGNVEAHIGTVEAQGRGTLHLHMMLWLTGSIPAPQMRERLLREDFRDRIKQFISTNIHAHIPTHPGESILSVPKQPQVAFSRPVDPRLPDYEVRKQDAEISIARTVQVHQCSQACMRLRKRRLVCKRNAPFRLAQEAWIDEHGDWNPKRLYGYFNNWCPSLLQCIRANHDIKLITNGEETKHITWYVTGYAIKDRELSANISALLAKTFAFGRFDQLRQSDLSRINKRLIERCANTLSRQQELSAPEVVNYLMGWNDRFVSHHFETIHWKSVMDLLCMTYPTLRSNRYVPPMKR